MEWNSQAQKLGHTLKKSLPFDFVSINGYDMHEGTRLWKRYDYNRWDAHKVQEVKIKTTVFFSPSLFLSISDGIMLKNFSATYHFSLTAHLRYIIYAKRTQFKCMSLFFFYSQRFCNLKEPSMLRQRKKL